METVIIGNGIIALTTAIRLSQVSKESDKITIIGKRCRPKSATAAAAAMLNSFCEIETDTFKSEIDTLRFEMSYEATRMWPRFVIEYLDYAVKRNCLIDECKTCMGSNGACFELGTYLINNCAADSLDDENYKAVLQAMEDFNEDYSEVDPLKIPNYNPEPRHRAVRAVYIPNEGWLNPKLVLQVLDALLESYPFIKYVDQEVSKIKEIGSRITSVVTSGGETIEGDRFLLACGAAASKLIEDSGLSINIPRIFNGVGCSIQIKSPEHPHTKVIGTPNRGLACGLYSVPFYTSPKVPLNELIIGATNLVTIFDLEGARVGSVASLLKGAMEQINMNFYKAEVMTVNLGYRPVSADTYPVFGSTSIKNLVICTGTKRDGFHLSPLLSQLLCSLLIGEEIDNKYDCFKPERALIRNLSREAAIEASVNHQVSAAFQHGYTPPHSKLNNMIKEMHRKDLETLHDKVGAYDWGIPPELIELYRYGHIK